MKGKHIFRIGDRVQNNFGNSGTVIKCDDTAAQVQFDSFDAPGWLMKEDLRPASAGGAAKNDSGKPQLSLIPREALTLMAQGFGYGAAKYGRYNFERGHNWSRVLDAALRHLTAIAAGEFTDAESGNPHLAHALCSLAMLAYNMEHYPELDDITRKKP